MGFTPEQIKGRIKSVAKQNNADARTLMRIYMMERFLDRLAQSEYRDNFIIKGGILVTAMIGVAHRSTMDIDTNDHQVEFARNVSKRMGTIIDVEDIETLGDIITNYDQIVAGMCSSRQRTILSSQTRKASIIR